MTQPSFTRFIGVDLGGGRGKKTALAVIEVGGGTPTVAALHPRTGEPPLYDALLLKTIRAYGEGAVICIDAPLTLPPCIRCQRCRCPGQELCEDAEVAAMRSLACSPENANRKGKPTFTPYTQRATEVYLNARREIPARETLGQGMGPLTARASHLVRCLADDFRLNQNLIEVHPRSTMELLGFYEPYKKRVDSRIDILAQLSDLSFGPGVWRERCRQSDHAFDAVMSAYIGYLRARDGWTMPSELSGLAPDTGCIWMPPATPEPSQEEGAAGSVQGRSRG